MEHNLTAAEWIYWFCKKHPEVEISISNRRTPTNGISIYMMNRDHTSVKQVVSYFLPDHDIQALKLSLDDLLITTMETMWKEVEKLWTNS